jgi:hypothetical protein
MFAQQLSCNGSPFWLHYSDYSGLFSCHVIIYMYINFVVTDLSLFVVLILPQPQIIPHKSREFARLHEYVHFSTYELFSEYLQNVRIVMLAERRQLRQKDYTPDETRYKEIWFHLIM